MAKLQVVIPYLSGRWVLDDCIESMGDTDVPVLVVDNSPDGDAAKYQDGGYPDNVSVRSNNGTNIGIAASWNEGLNEGADQTLIVSQTVRFAPAEHPRRKKGWGLGRVADAIDKHASEYGLTFGDQGYHLISIGRKTVDEIGLFDENFVYTGEDDDYHHRLGLAGIKLPDTDPEALGAYSIGFAIQKRIPGVSDEVLARHGRIKHYYHFKWCSSHDKYPGDYKTPFGNPNNPMSYWPEVKHG